MLTFTEHLLGVRCCAWLLWRLAPAHWADLYFVSHPPGYISSYSARLFVCMISFNPLVTPGALERLSILRLRSSYRAPGKERSFQQDTAEGVTLNLFLGQDLDQWGRVVVVVYSWTEGQEKGARAQFWKVGDMFYFIYFLLFKNIFIYLFLDRGEGKEKERERNMNVWLPLTHLPYQGPGSQPRRVPWLGIKPATLWSTGRHSIHWATPARERDMF